MPIPMMALLSRLATTVNEPSARLVNVLMLAFVVLLPAEPLFNAPLIALGALGLLRLTFRRVRLGSPGNRFLCIAFLCVWLPMLASLPDAVNPIKSIRTSAGFCIYFLAGVYAVGAYTRFQDLDRVMTGVTAICAFLCLDALWQFSTGADWFGIPYQEGERLRGPFYIDGRLGITLACFAPLFFESIRRMSRRWPWSPILLIPFAVPILLSGSRGAWGALAVGIAGYLLFLSRWSDRSRWKPGQTAGICAATVLALVLAAYAWPDGVVRAKETVQPRIGSLTGLWSGDRERIEKAVSYRLSMWETAVNMFSAHWLNGVGPRGFRFVYREYSPEQDYFGNTGWFDLMEYPVNTPHLPVLEIATDTGVVGLLGYVVLATVFFSGLRRLELDSFRSTYPYALTLIVALFPLNGHLAFYRVFSAGIIWWMIILVASAFAIASRRESQETPVK